MKRIILYIGLVIAFLAAVFALNGVYINLQKNAQEQKAIAEEIIDESLILSNNLPIIKIYTNGQEISKYEEILAEISIYEHYEVIAESHPAAMLAAIKYRGNSSYFNFDKKQYRIEFRRDNNTDKNADYSILGMASASDWVLNGPFLDRSLSRNYLGFKVSSELLPWASDTAYCEVYINDEYQGLYLMIEPVTNEMGRLNLNNYSLISGRCSYIVKMDRADEEENALQTYGVINCLIKNDISVSYPTPANLTELQKEYITNDISEFEKALCSDNFADPDLGYAKYIDVDSFVDYFIISEMMMVTDAGFLSTYYYKDLEPDAKLKITVWDFNNSYDNIPWDVKSFEEFYLVEGNWFNRLVQDKGFVEKIINRYYELRQGILSDESLIGMVDENIEYLGSAVDRNFDLWGYTFDEYMLSEDRDPRSFDDAIDMLKDAIVTRGAFLDDNIESLYDYCIN